MKIVLLLCLVAVALAAPQDVVKDDRVGPAIDGTYSFDFETSDGIAHNEVGSVGIEGAIVQRGSYRYTDDEGNTFEVRYVADENGFQPEGDHLPVAP